jgi:hypothetical protein
MVKSIERYASETIVVVHARLRKAPKPVKNATIHDHELDIFEVHRVAGLVENVPFTVYDAENINRDKEDVDDDDAGDDTDETTPDTTGNNTPRDPQANDSEEWTRLVEKGLDSKSKNFQVSRCFRANCV